MIEKFIKSECGLSEYKRLRTLSKDKPFSKLRLYFFVVIATIRDLFK
mgnify:FL=1